MGKDSRPLLFHDTHHIVHKRVLKKNAYIVLYKTFDDFVRSDRIGRRCPISLDKSARTQFYSAKITYHYDKDIGKSERVDLPQNRFTGRTRRLSIVIRPKLGTGMPQHIGPANMTGIVVLFLITGDSFLDFVEGRHRYCKGNEFTHFLLIQPLGKTSYGKIGIVGHS